MRELVIIMIAVAIVGLPCIAVTFGAALARTRRGGTSYHDGAKDNE